MSAQEGSSSSGSTPETKKETNEQRLAMLTLSIVDDLRSGAPLDLAKCSDAETLANRILTASVE